jgi:hypothetical protein
MAGKSLLLESALTLASLSVSRDQTIAVYVALHSRIAMHILLAHIRTLGFGTSSYNDAGDHKE